MKRIFITIVCLQIFASLHAQGITLLYKNDMGWNDSLSWIQIKIPAGQTPIQRVPTENDEVVFSYSMSGISSVGFETDNTNPDFNIGGRSANGPSRCRSMHISHTDVSFSPENFSDYGASVNVYTSSGGFVILDSGSNVSLGIFQLHGGNPTVTDLEVINSTFGVLTDYTDYTDIYMDSNSKARLVGSIYGGMNFGGGSLYAENSTINTGSFTLGDNSTDTILNSTIEAVGLSGYLRFLIGRNSNFVSGNVTVKSNSTLEFCTSGSMLNGNVSSLSYGGGNFSFLQEDPANPLPNIINGNLHISENEAVGFNGDVKISGDFIFDIIDEFHDGPSYVAPVVVNGQHAFDVGGVINYGGSLSVTDCANNYCHYKLEFFGNTNSNISWPGGFPVDTLVINKTGCSKVTIDNSLYVSGATKIESGQLVLNPNDNHSYKFVCEGNVDIAQGGGLFLRKDAAGFVANMAVEGTLVDHNTSADSSCAGLSNPYNGIITFYRASLPDSPHDSLFDFNGSYHNKTITLTWSTEGEINTKYFIAEKSFDQVTFLPLGNITASGNAGKNDYQFTDRSSLKAINYYKLKIINADSLFTYSNIIAIAAPVSNEIIIFPNPSKDKLFFRLADVSAETEIIIADARGIIVKKLQLKAGIMEASVNILDLPPGVYSISFQSGKSKSTQQFVRE